MGRKVVRNIVLPIVCRDGGTDRRVRLAQRVGGVARREHDAIARPLAEDRQEGHRHRRRSPTPRRSTWRSATAGSTARSEALDDEHWCCSGSRRGGRAAAGRRSTATRSSELIEQGRMRPAGLAEVERAKADGRWDAAYDGQRTATVPDDLRRRAGRRTRRRAAFFATLDSRQPLRDPLPRPGRQEARDAGAADREVRRDARRGQDDPPLTSAVAGVVRRAIGVLDLDEVAPRVGAGAVDVGEAVDLGEAAAGQRLPVPARHVGVGRERRDGAADERGRLGDAEVRDPAVASRQFASVTPKGSSIASERSQPGVSATAVAPCGSSSCACAHASRITAFLARS